MSYPVRYSVHRPIHFTRLQLLLRVLAFCAIGMLGLSFGAVFFAAYLLLPIYAASRISAKGGEAYLRDDGPRILGGIRWLAAVSAWAGLTSERLPTAPPSTVVSLDVERDAALPSTSSSALWRILTGIPSAIALCVLCWLGTFVWLWAALTVLFSERVGDGAFHFLLGLQRWSIRLLAYQASLVDEYPPFSFGDLPPSLPEARTVSAD